MKIIRIHAGEYDVKIGADMLETAGSELAALGKSGKAFIVSDSAVWPLYGERCASALKKAGFETEKFIFPQGEEHKTMATLSRILEAMADTGITRSDTVVALGGGVTGDMAGFAAAVYTRGIDFIQIPTTLLSAVDASVGGKTAVDLTAGKNLAGAFHQPRLVLCDTDILSALPETLLQAGSAEMIKCGVLGNEALFARMADGSWRDNLEECVAACVKMKGEYVDADERDGGVRQLLNLGHTFGHAAEALAHFSISHAQGVAMGLVMAFRAAGLDDKEIISCAEACGLSWQCPYGWEEMTKAALLDKKRRGDSITLILPEKIGCCQRKKVPIAALGDYFRRGLGDMA